MSYSWRERLRRAKKHILDNLDIEESEKEKTWKYIWDNIGSFCKESDDQVRLVYGDRCNIDEEVERMFQSEFEEMASDIVLKILERLGYPIKKKSKKKKRIAQNGQTGKEVETEEATDTDSDSDSDSESENIPEEEAEVIKN